MTPLREKMKQEMTLYGYSLSTQDRYINEVIKLQAFYNVNPAKLKEPEIRSYLLSLKKRI